VERTTLATLVEALDDLDDELAIYASRQDGWRPDSPAVAIAATKNGALRAEAAELSYFLEVPIAKEAIRVWSDWRGGAQPDTADRVEAVIYYAENDAYLPVQE